MSQSTNSLWEEGQLPGLSGPKQAAAALRLIRAHLVPMLVIWVVLAIVSYGQIYLTTSLGLMAQPGLSARFLAVVVGGALVGAAISGTTLRVLLGRPVGVDSGFLTYIGIVTLVAVVPAVLTKLLVGAPPAAGDTSAAMALMGKSLGVLVFYLLFLYAGVKLMLWPIGLAVGDREVTPGVSWNLTKRAFWGYIIGALLLGGIPYIIVVVMTVSAGRAGGTAAAVPPLTAPFTALFSLAFTAVAAALFHLRRSGEGDPGAVFD